MDNTKDFEVDKCIVVDNFFDDTTTYIISNYLENKICRGELNIEEDPQAGITRYNYYADPLIETLMVLCKESVERHVNRELLPTYSHVHIFQSNDTPQLHSKVEAREISVVICIAFKGEPSLIHVQQGEKNSVATILQPGSAIIYRGCEVKQWTAALSADQLSVQVMLHYVEKNGPFKDFANDTRPRIGLDKIKKRV